MENNSSRVCDLFTTTDDCHYLLTSGPDFISNILRQGQVWEESTLDISKKLIQDIDSPVLIDIGANLGAWSVPMSRHIKNKKGVIYAYEPQRQVHNQLCGNIFLNQITNCYITNAAVGDHDGEISVPVLDIYTDPNLGALALDPEVLQEQRSILPENHESVPLHMLDTLDLPHAHLVKIDVEGMELEVLTGGKEWLAKCGYPYILFEAWGDYMKTTIEKKKKIHALLADELGYEIVEFGELFVAQHPSSEGYKMQLTDYGFTVKKETKMFGKDFLSY